MKANTKMKDKTLIIKCLLIPTHKKNVGFKHYDFNVQ